MNLLLKIFCNLHEHYNHLKIAQIRDYLQMLLQVQALFGLACARIKVNLS